jgi:septal ring factor EnvC (AmiA/AmiB activator)
MGHLVSLFFLIMSLFQSALLAAYTSPHKRHQLHYQSSRITQLGGKLRELEKKLGHTNNQYLQALAKIKEVEQDVELYEQKLIEEEKKQALKHQHRLAILRSYSLSLVDDEFTDEKAYLALFEENEKTQKTIQATLESLKNILNTYRERLEQLRSDESQLAQLNQDLSQKKLAISDQIVKERNQLSKIDKIKIQEKSLQKIKLSGLHETLATKKFQLPLQKYFSLQDSQKGITLIFKGSLPLYAPAEGRIVFNGDLASYGQVLMIDHGEEVKTVMLGEFESTLQKNDTVKLGDKIGVTLASADNLYFEVRKKNLAQKTIHWIEKKTAGTI